MAKLSTKSILQFVVLLGIGVLLIWLSVKQVEPEKDKIFSAFKSADYFWIAISMVIAFFSHFLRAYRWNYLLNPLGYKTTLANAFCHVMIGYFANYGIPRMGEVSRCTLAARYDNVPFEVGFGTVITERIVDFIIFVLIFFLTLLIQFTELIGLANKLVFNPISAKLSGLGNSPVKIIALIVIILILAVAFFIIRKKVSSLLKGRLGKIVSGVLEGIGSIRKMKNPFRFLVLSLLIWLCYFYSLYDTSRSKSFYF